MGFSRLVDTLANGANEMQMRQATVISVEAGCTCTLDVAGTTVTGVRYISPPRPGTSCWITWQGGAPIVVGSIADTYSIPSSMIQANGTTSLANNTWTAIPNGGTLTWQNDAWEMIDDTTGTFTAPCDGMWQFTASASWVSNVTGVRGLRIMVGAATLAFAQVAPINGSQTAVSCGVTAGLAKGATAQAQMLQTSGAALNTAHQQFSASWTSG